MDVVYVVRDGFNEELRHSLRSLANLPHAAVWVIGNPPTWIRNVNVVRAPRGGDPSSSSLHKWLTAVAIDDVSDQFVVMGDDFFVMQPVDELPILHRGALFTHANQHMCDGVLSDYGQALLRTRSLLAAEGVKSPVSYETHTPLAVDKAGFAKALEAKAADPGLCERSIYGNRAKLGGVKSDQVKVCEQAGEIPDGLFLSTTPMSFRIGTVGRHIRRAFPAPSPYEVAR